MKQTLQKLFQTELTFIIVLVIGIVTRYLFSYAKKKGYDKYLFSKLQFWKGRRKK